MTVSFHEVEDGCSDRDEGERVAVPPRRPAEFTIIVEYSLSVLFPERVDQTIEATTNTFTSQFEIEPVESGEPEEARAKISRRFGGRVYLEQMRIRNGYGIGVRITILRRGEEALRTVLSPGGLLVLRPRDLDRDDCW